MLRKTSIAPGEWYHCYTRGIDGRTTFQDREDYWRFIETLYTSNSDTSLERGRLFRLSHAEIMDEPRGAALVSIGAYCLMPNHFHLILKGNDENGLSAFMRKLGIGYAMYFNKKYGRIGNLFVKPFRSRHIGTDSYLRRVIPYIHLNPVELFEPLWKKGVVNDLKQVQARIESYDFSSLPDYLSDERPTKAVLDRNVIEELLSAQMPPLEALLSEMAEYYAELELATTKE